MLWRTGHTAASEVQANYRWTDKQISSRSEYREYAAPTAAPPTTMATLRANSPSSNQSLLGTAPTGSTLVQESNHSTFYASPLSDVTKTVQHWIAAYESDGSPDAAPILYRYLEQASVNVSAGVEKVGYVFNGSSTLRSKSTFTESDQGTIETYRGLERQEPNSFNNWTVTYAPVQSHTGGITQTITHSKPAADNTVTLPGQGTHSTVASGGEHHAGTSTLATYLTVQQPLAEFVGQFSTKTGYVSNSVVSPGNGGLSDAGGQDTGTGTGDETEGDSADQIASKLAEIETLMREGLANANRLSLEQLKSLATGTYHSVYDPELGMFAIKPMASDRWYLFESYTAPTGQAAAPTHAPVYTSVQMGVYWRLRGWEPGELNPDLVKEGYQLRRDLAFWNGAKDATEFTLHLLPGGSFVDKVAGESDDSWGYVLFVSAGDCLMLAGCFMKAGTRGARIVNGLSIGENLGGAGLAGYQGLGENGQYSHGGDFVLRLVAVGLGARNVQLKQKLGELGELAPIRGAGLVDDAAELAAQRRLIEMTGNTRNAHYLGKHSPLVSDQALIDRATRGIDPWTGAVRTNRRGQIVNLDSTRFNSYQDMLESIQKAQRSFAAQYPGGVGIPSGGGTVTIDMLRDVGVGYAKDTGVFRSGLTRVRVLFDEFGQVISAYPLYR